MADTPFSAAASGPVEPPRPSVPHDPLSQTLALLQPWIDYVPKQQRRLGLFICLALALHATTFFFLTIDNSVAEMQHQPRTYVSIEQPSAVATDDQAEDQFWGRLTDPRIFLLPQNAQGDLASEMPSVPISAPVGSRATPQPSVPASYVAPGTVVSPLEQQIAQAMSPPRQAFGYDETPPATAAKTTWQWDDVLTQRQPAGVPDLPSPVSDTDLSPTQLRIAIDSDGTVRHALVEQSSGDQGASIAKDLDQQAVLAAQKLRFAPTPQPGLQWGRATIFWRYSAKPREEVVPTPPTPGP